MTLPLLKQDLEHVLTHAQAVWPELRGARLFITGGTGFFGKWLLETFIFANRALSLNASVLVLSRNPATFCQQMPHVASDPAIRFFQGDVSSFAFPRGDISHVIHAATETTARLGQPQSLETLETIVSGTRRVLDLARDRHIKAMLFTSSGAVYGRQPPELTHTPEDNQGAPDPLDANAAYGNGKRFAEHLCAAYHARCRVETKIARCFAFVGPHLPLDAHFAIGNFIGDVLAGRTVTINGDGSPYRSYLYAADLTSWLWTILVRGQAMHPYNVGSEQSLSIRELATIMARMGAPGWKAARQPQAGVAPPRYVPSTVRARNELGLDAWVGLNDAIERTLYWHRAGGQVHAV
jgi:dTDP-glucose 4,6-dehydratase